MKTNFVYIFKTYVVDLIASGKTFRATIGERTADLEILHAEVGKLELLIDGERVTAYISSDGTKRWVTVNGRTFVLTKQSGSRKSMSGHHHSQGELTAPMPGQVRAVNVREGDEVTKGQTLLVLEAMKMEIRIQAPMDGTVSKLSITQGQTVEREQILIEIV